MFSSALARRVCAPALRPTACTSRVLPPTTTPLALRQLSQAATLQQPAAAASKSQDLRPGTWPNNNQALWNAFMGEMNKGTAPKERPPAQRTAQAEGVSTPAQRGSAASPFDQIRDTMPAREQLGAHYRVAEAEDHDAEWRRRSASIVPALIAQGIPNAYTGRSFVVRDGDVNDAYRSLQRRLNVNNVRNELKRQARHEKKGVKRRRLASERWRHRFAEEVRKKVQLVQQIQARRA